MHKLIKQTGFYKKRFELKTRRHFFTLFSHFFDCCNLKILLSNILYNAGVMSQGKKSFKRKYGSNSFASSFSSNTALQNIQITKRAIRDRFIYSETLFLSKMIFVERVQITTKATKRYKKGSLSAFLGGFC